MASFCGTQAFGIRRQRLFADPTIDADNRAHGLNERIGVRAIYDQLEFTYRLLKEGLMWVAGSG